MTSTSWAICKCFFERNFFVKGWNAHVTYVSDHHFRQEHAHRPHLEETIAMIKKEAMRRRRTKFEVGQRKETIRQMYKHQLHPEVYKFSQSHMDPLFLESAENAFSMLKPSSTGKYLQYCKHATYVRLFRAF